MTKYEEVPFGPGVTGAWIPKREPCAPVVWPAGAEDDFRQALEVARGNCCKAEPFGAPTPPIIEADVTQVMMYRIRYGNTDWAPGQETESELELVAILLLCNGNYASLVAGNDYTGWGCEDFGRLRIGSKADVMSYGLSKEDRAALGLTDLTWKGQA